LGSLLFPESGNCDSLDESFIDVTMAWQQYNKDAMTTSNEINVNLLK
jgi:hypothetical protein